MKEYLELFLGHPELQWSLRDLYDNYLVSMRSLAHPKNHKFFQNHIYCLVYSFQCPVRLYFVEYVPNTIRSCHELPIYSRYVPSSVMSYTQKQDAGSPHRSHSRNNGHN
jgi:hypothetical protein